MKSHCRNNGRKGAELLEFTFVLLPLLATIFVLMDISWAIFSKSTLQRAVLAGVRNGVTITGAQATGGKCLTEMVKTTVQQNALGLLTGTSGLNKIKVNYFKPPAPNSTAAALDVSAQVFGNTPGNIMQVSIQNYSLMPLVPRIFDWKTAADKAPLNITVYSADMIEPSRDPPCIGTAP